MMICSACGYRSPKGITGLAACYHYDCIMRGKCKLLNEKYWNKVLKEVR